MTTDNPMKVCCICGYEYEGFGNNPEPFGQHGDRACDDCNDRIVVPTRMVIGRDCENSLLIEVIKEIAARGRFMVQMKKDLTAVKPKRTA
jgi:hypothetical protein